MKTIRFGILGNASIARGQMIPGLKLSKHCELAAIASRSEVPADLEPEVKHYSSYEALLSDPDIDAVYIPLPNALHCKWAIAAMEKGKHVLCEKPIAMNEQEAREMFACAEKNNVKLMEAFMYRHSPKTLKALELVKAGAIGSIRHAHAHHGYTLNWDSPARQDKTLGGGSVYDVGCYCVSLVNLLLGAQGAKPAEVTAVFNMTEAGYDEHTIATVRYDNGALATLESWFDAAGDQRAFFVGEKGTLEIPRFPSGGKDVIILTNQDGRQEIEVEGVAHLFACEADNLALAIHGEAELLVSAGETIANMNTMDRIHALRP